MGRDLVSIVAAGGSLLLMLGALVVADVRWNLERLPNWVICLLVGAGFALWGLVIGMVATDGDWGDYAGRSGHRWRYRAGRRRDRMAAAHT